MSEFKEAPLATLALMGDVKAAIETPDWRKARQKDKTEFRIKSLWIIGLINELLATSGRDFVYNADVKKLAEQRLGYPPKPEAEYSNEGDALSLLIYNAQCYRRSDDLIAKGYEPFTPALICRAGVGGQITMRSGLVLNVREVSGRIYAMKKGARTNAAMPNGAPVKITKQGKPYTMPKIGDRAELLVACRMQDPKPDTNLLPIGTTGTLEERMDDDEAQFLFIADHDQGKTFVSPYEVRVLKSA